MATFIYGHPQHHYKNNSGMKSQIKPLMLLGELLDLSQKKFVNNEGNYDRYDKFKNILYGNGIADIHLPYTWLNNTTLATVLKDWIK